MADGQKRSGRKGWRKPLFSAALGGIFGFIGSIGFLWLGDSGTLGEITLSRQIASLVGLIYLLTATVLAIGLVSPRAGAGFLNVEDADELREQARQLRYSATGMAATGIALVVLALAEPAGAVPRIPALAATVGLLALVGVLSIVQYRLMDELMRRVSQDTGSLCFYLLAAFGGGWAMLAHLELTAGPAPLDWLTMMAGFTLVAAFVTVSQRGMLQQR